MQLDGQETNYNAEIGRENAEKNRKKVIETEATKEQTNHHWIENLPTHPHPKTTTTEPTSNQINQPNVKPQLSDNPTPNNPTNAKRQTTP